jgi:hypothetical protein
VLLGPVVLLSFVVECRRRLAGLMSKMSWELRVYVRPTVVVARPTASVDEAKKTGLPSMATGMVVPKFQASQALTGARRPPAHGNRVPRALKQASASP